MAIVVTSLTKGTDTDGNSTATTASVTIPANCLATLRVNSRTSIGAGTTPNTPTATSTGAVWEAIHATEGNTEYDNSSSSRKKLSVLRTMVASDQTSAVTIDFGGQNQTDVEWSIEVTDATVDTSGSNGSGAVVQVVKGTDANGGAITVNLGAFGNVNNATMGFFANDSGTGTMTAGSGFAALGVNAGATLNGGTEWKNSNDTSVDATFDAVVGATTGGIAIEVKALSVAGLPVIYKSNSVASISS